jgi:hypothetical protein
MKRLREDSGSDGSALESVTGIPPPHSEPNAAKRTHTRTFTPYARARAHTVNPHPSTLLPLPPSHTNQPSSISPFLIPDPLPFPLPPRSARELCTSWFWWIDLAAVVPDYVLLIAEAAQSGGIRQWCWQVDLSQVRAGA